MSLLIQDQDFSGVAGAVATGILRGNILRTWWNSFPPVNLMDLPGSKPESRMQYFFSELPIDDVPTSIMGCLQTSTFQRRPLRGQPSVSLAEWVGTNFLRRARWTNSDGTEGGFQYRPVMVLDPDSNVGVRRVEPDLDLQIADVGTRYTWAAVRLDLLDYMRAVPVIGKHNRLLEPLNREAGYMVLHPDFFHTPYPQPAGCVEEFCFAYTVSPWTVLPTIAAYGPGRFFSAFKQFRFFLLEDGRVAVEVLFLVAPRCHRVFNIFGFDPVFHTVAALNVLTLGLTKIVERAHAGVDHYAMGHHARVHENVLNGMRRIWEETNWQPRRVRQPELLQAGSSR